VNPGLKNMKYLKVFIVLCLVLGFLLGFSSATMTHWFPAQGHNAKPDQFIGMFIAIFIPLAMAFFLPAGLILGPIIDSMRLRNPAIIMSAQVMLTAGMFTLLVYWDDLRRKKKTKDE
jgi:ribose/xylose/arabinose/galactoside ABC-type transport system permease subunit